MHVHVTPIDLGEVVRAKPIQASGILKGLSWIFVLAGIVTFGVGVLSHDAAHIWGVYFVNAIFFFGLSAGSLMLPVIFQIVRATWSGPVRRMAEANLGFFPLGAFLVLLTYFGKEHLFYWGSKPMPGREWWMEPGFVYVRFIVLFSLLGYLFWRFISLSLRADIGFIQESGAGNGEGSSSVPLNESYSGWFYSWLTKGWKGAEVEVPAINRKLSVMGPVVVFFYAVITSLFAFEMIQGMDPSWVSNLFGAFIFMTNIYIGWATLSISTVYHSSRNSSFKKTVSTQQFWDLGKLSFGFCMIWGYFFFSQFLPQWYGNLPEETQWLILRTREFPWKGWAWVTFACAFIVPFIVLVSEDVKKNYKTLVAISVVVLIGVWLDRYLIVMPQVSPIEIPFGISDVLITLGFLGAYVLCLQSVIARWPFIALAHPLTHGSEEW